MENFLAPIPLARALVRASTALTLAVATSSPALADQELANRLSGIQAVPLALLPAVGSVPTFYVNLDPHTMADLMRRDREEGRRYLSSDRPSLLEPFVVKQKFLPAGNSSGNGFSQGNTYICITSLTVSIPAWNNVTPVPAAYDQPVTAYRGCSAYAPWAPVIRGSSAINTLYANFGVKVYSNTAHKVQVLIPVAQVPSGVTVNPEPTTSWGLAFFDTNGTGGKVQEVVWVQANYVLN